jgi:L-ornithine Nalpha-acyltransferase
VIVFSGKRYCARLGQGPVDMEHALTLRQRCFRPETGASDRDAFDAKWNHLLIEDLATGALVATCRYVLWQNGSGIRAGYAGQFYNLSRLARYRAPMLELGRFCTLPDRSDPDVLRTAWGALVRLVDHHRVGMMFGCTSLAGTKPADHAPVFATLHSHLAPAEWQPDVMASEIILFADHADAVRSIIPPLLQSYLALGAWVSNHAVIDRDLNTVHLFTGLEISAIPPARLRLFRALAAYGQPSAPFG